MTGPLSFERRRNGSFYPPDFFASPSEEELEQELSADAFTFDIVPSIEVEDIPRDTAREKYAELNRWNRAKHDYMIKLLEPHLLGLADRLSSFIITNPEQVRRKAGEIETYHVPFKFAGLPPNLYDHLDPMRPFLPDTREEILALVNEYKVYNERLRHLQKWDVISIGKEDFYQDLAAELSRQQKETDQKIFSTYDDLQQWREYNHQFRQQGHRYGARPTFHQSVAFINYLNNREFAQATGFFDKTDGTLDAFLLADFYPTRSAFVSQLRVPFQYREGAQDAAEKLLKAAHVIMGCIADDALLNAAAEDIQRRPEVRKFLLNHLTRAQELEAQDFIVRALRGMLFESVASISTLFATCEADGIPGFEDDLWGGLEAMLRDDVPVKVTSLSAPGVTASPALYRVYFKNMLETTRHGLRVRPGAAGEIQAIQDRVTAMLHASWQTYYEQSSQGITGLKPPVRFGLHCPFKNEVVRQFSELLILCRAAIHDEYR